MFGDNANIEENNEDVEFNFSPPESIPSRWIFIGKGIIKVTKVNLKDQKSFFSKEDQREQWYMYIDHGSEGYRGMPIYRIYRRPEECKDKKGKYLSTKAFTKSSNGDDKFIFYLDTDPEIKYNLTLIHDQREQSLNDFFKGIKPDTPYNEWITSLQRNNPIRM
jgi:hypothetical protein